MEPMFCAVSGIERFISGSIAECYFAIESHARRGCVRVQEKIVGLGMRY
jgi:hypothetical protein